MEGSIDLGGIQNNKRRHCEVFLGKYLFLNFKNIKRNTYNLAKHLFLRDNFWMAASDCDKKTLISHDIEAAARYCFEVFGVPPKKSKSLKTTFF